MNLLQYPAAFFIGIYLSLFNRTRKPHINTPVIYKLDWWTYQNNLSIENLELELVEERGNLFNHVSIIKYSIRGTLNIKNGWDLCIKKIHISERYVKDEKDNSVVIELTPVVNGKSSKGTQEKNVAVVIENEHQIRNYQWGENVFRIRCGVFEKSIKITQRK